ncbi:unnamed protein product [Heligmosomoides polygyrus]|uniref:Beta-lactamase domain-containing protein n=1 Tax=Heligmosomoides polygyrus TaxID=6339 RepID=A0A183GG60_HELPZ|nr:unnamed protein product [Heligmosomoides polygyrus]
MALIQTNRVGNASVTAAVCRDSDLARFMNNAMATYIHDMDGLSKSILDQIVSFRKPGTWMVHAEVISGRAQGRDWQTTTNGDVFSGRSMYGCFYHDMQTYILVWRSLTGVLCDRKIPEQLKSKIYRAVVRPVAMYGAECWPATKEVEARLSVKETKMLRWTAGVTCMDRTMLFGRSSVSRR